MKRLSRLKLLSLSVGAIFLLCAFWALCDGRNLKAEQPVSSTEWAKLAGKRIFFGHQSVGYNILAGVEDLERESQAPKLKIIEMTGQNIPAGPALIHERVGTNGNPFSKCDDFARKLEGLEPGIDIATFKFCFVDITARTDVAAVFDYYKKTMAKLKLKYPATRFVYVTVPLTTVQEGPRAFIKKLLGWPVGGYDDNIARNVYNELLRKEYEGKDPVFDLALAESEGGTGSRCSFTVAGKSYPCLRPDFTTDGGHLNERGRKIVARRFLEVLAGE